MDGDRPITRLAEDRLGFSPIADELAAAIANLPTTQGFVFGIEGRWGSGKSTLINLTIDALGSFQQRRPEIITFAPWLVGDRDELLRSLFNELADAAVRIDPLDDALAASPSSSIGNRISRTLSNAHWRLREKQRLKKRLSGKLKAFGSLASSVGKMARLADAAGVPFTRMLAETAERSSDAAIRFLQTASVAKEKAELVGALKALSRPIAVFIDDLDRLEPRDASEVLRLVRAVADFPNVIYILSYDQEVVSKILTQAVGVDDGAAYLEKMVQVAFRVPRPEAFDLRRWFQSEVFRFFAAELKTLGDARTEIEQRLLAVIDTAGGRYLETGRDVVRTLNALQLHTTAVRRLIDIPDMVWLQLVRIGNDTLYRWTEKYVTEVAAVAKGATMTDVASNAMLAEFETILKGENLDVDQAMLELGEVLPGLDTNLSGQKNFSKMSEATI